VELLATNERDPYTDHNFLRYLADPDSLGNEVSKQELARVKRLAASFELEGDELYKKGEKGKRKIVPSPANRKLFVKAEHEQIGHCGRDKLRALLASKYWWPKMDNIIN
jgi:hypothetical protein